MYASSPPPYQVGAVVDVAVACEGEDGLGAGVDGLEAALDADPAGALVVGVAEGVEAEVDDLVGVDAPHAAVAHRDAPQRPRDGLPALAEGRRVAGPLPVPDSVLRKRAKCLTEVRNILGA